SAPGFGAREVAGMLVDIRSSLTPLRAGKQATFTFSFSRGGVPVGDIQPWLGMAGHMIARDATGAIFAHVHAVGPMAPSGILASGIVYGPDIRFAYTFPQPGRYQIWGQFRHEQQIVTVPLEVTVEYNLGLGPGDAGAATIVPRVTHQLVSLSAYDLFSRSAPHTGGMRQWHYPDGANRALHDRNHAR
ncbi:MAG: hypothetical protein ABIV47_06025, partial [Roseiflexaceae bacterium]